MSIRISKSWYSPCINRVSHESRSEQYRSSPENHHTLKRSLLEYNFEKIKNLRITSLSILIIPLKWLISLLSSLTQKKLSSTSTQRTILQAAHSKLRTSRDWRTSSERSESISSEYLRIVRSLMRSSAISTRSVSHSSQTKMGSSMMSMLWSERRRIMAKSMSALYDLHFSSTLQARYWKNGEMWKRQDMQRRYSEK